jgi:hypothetical protein
MTAPESQYQELCEEYRLVLRLFWEIPSIVMVIVSGLLIGSFSFIPDERKLLRVFLLLLSSLMLSIALLSGWKHRKFAFSYIEMLKKYDGIPRCTPDLNKWIRNQREQRKLIQCSKVSLQWNVLLNLRVQKVFLTLLFDILFGFITFTILEFVPLVGMSFPTEEVIIYPIERLVILIFILLVLNVWLYRHLD